MIWYWALLVFLASTLDDILYVFFVRRVLRGSKLSAALLSGLITAVVGFECYWQYAQDIIYLFPNTVGSCIGCPLAMWIEEKWPVKKPRDKKGKFKHIPELAKILPETLKED